MIAVIQHHEKGGKVQHTCKNNNLRWNDMLEGQEPSWDFSCVNYRIKPEPLVLWLDVESNIVVQGLPFPFISGSGIPARKFVEVTE